MLNKNIKTVLISTISLPHEGIASWTTEMNYLLKRENKLDYIIGPYSNIKIEKPIQIFIDKISLLDKIKSKIDYINRFNPYLRSLKQVLKSEENIILQVKDNLGLLKAIISFLNKNNFRKRVFLQYHHHSFYSFLHHQELLEEIDELVVLTTSVYKKIKDTVNTFPISVSIINDGVNSSLFTPVSILEKQLIREKKGIDKEKIIFIWCSQDRKKKGLDLTIRIWKELIKKHKNIELLLFGTHKEIDVKTIKVMGLVNNTKLAEYYQLADFYLFPTLCQEGFGLSLVEALKSGCYCIAANNGAVPEVLNNGEYGKLINNPNIIENWIFEINNAIEIYLNNGRNNPYLNYIPNDLYDIKKWYKNYNTIIVKTKESFRNRYYI